MKFKILLPLLVCIWVLAGCQSTQTGIKVTLENCESFPSELAGRWKADDSPWEFEFDKDGKITKTVIDFAQLDMEPGKIRIFETKGGGEGVYEPGLWTVRYNGQTREIEVVIEIDHFYQDIGKYSLEGDRVDTILGQISEDKKKWDAVWLSQYTFIANMEESEKFDEVKEPRFMRELRFRKMENDISGN